MKYLYDEVGSKISPVLYNFSMNARYLQYGAQYIFACHGNRKHQIRRWVRERLLFCDTLFDYAPTTTSKSITLRCNRLGNVSLDIDTYQPMYVQVKWRNGTVQKLKVNRGQTTTFTGYLATATDQEVLIYSAPYLKSIGDISYLNPNSIDIGNANRLTYLKCNCEALLKADVSANPYLRYIDLTNCPKLGTAVGSNVLNVSGCDNLKDLYIRGTSLTSVQSNIEGGNIQNIVFPNTVQSIDLRNMYVLKSLDIPLNSALNSLTLVNCPNLETLRGNSSLSDLEIYQNIQTINFQNSLNIENFEIIPYNLISLALRNMPNTKSILIKNDENNSLINTTLNTCVIDECNNLVSFKIGTNLSLVNNRTIDLSSAEGLEEIICTNNISGLDTIYIPTSVKKLIFTGTSNSIKNILVKENPDRPQGFTGIDLTGCNSIEEFDMIALTNVKNVIGLDLTLTKNPNFNTNRTVENYIQPEGRLDLTNYEGINMSNLFKGIDFNKLDVTLPENLSDVIDASSMFRKCTFSTTINPDTIISKMTSIQNASYMFADCGFTADIRPTLVLESLLNLSDASYMFANCTGLVNFNDIEISDSINTTNMFQGIAVEEIKNLNMSYFPFTITDKLVKIGNITLSQATSVENLFKNNKVLTTVGDISLPLVTNASHMFDGCTKLATIGTVSIPSATDLSYMYNNCIKLTTYNDIMNYPEVTNISYMYSNTKISSIGNLTLTDDVITTNVFGGVALSEVGNINTGNILFDLAYVTTIGNFTIRNEESATNLFKDNKLITSIGNINMPLVTNASHMFDGCTNLTTIGSINMPAVTDMSYAFAGTKVGYIDISKCTSITDVSYMYKGNTGIESIDTITFGELVNVRGLLEECTNLVSIGTVSISSTDVSYLFDRCTKLATIESLSLDNVTTANYMFNGCSALTLTSLNMPSVLYASHMFENCSLLTQNPLTAPLVQNVSYMFYNCIGLTSAFDVQEVFPSVTDASYIFKGCVNITSIGDFALSDTIISTGMFEGTSITRVGNVTANVFPFDSSKLISAGNITLSCDDVQDLFKDNTVLTTIGDITLNNVTNASHMFDGCSSLSTIGTITAPLLENTSYMFRNCVLITTMLDFTNYPNLTNVDYMYAGCTGLPKEIETLELSDTITSSTGLLDNVGITSIGTMNIPTIACSLNSIESIDSLTVRNTVDAKALFKDNTSLTSINSVSLPSATNIAGLFKGCSNITNIGSVSAPNATIAYESNVGGLFDECTSLTSTPDISGLPKITIGDYMFNGCSMLTNINTSVFEQLYSVDNMFNGCTELTTIGDLDLSDVESVSTMFNGCENISTVGNIIAPEFMMPTTNLTTIGDLTLTNSSNIELFKDAINLTTIGNVNLPNCLDSNSMFSGCIRLVNIGEINAPKCTNISNMFKGCTSLVNAPNTDKCVKVTNASGLYSGCTKLRNMQNLVFPEIIDSTGILQGCTITSLNDIDLNDIDFNTKNCTTLGNVTLRGATSAREKFRNNFKLTTIGNVSIPNAEDVSYMFADCSALINIGTINIPNLSNASYMFSGCTSMTSMIDLSGFASLRNASYMFRGCTGLPSTLGDIILPEVENVTGMFENVTITAVGNIDLIELPFNTTSLTSIGNMKLTTTNAFKMFYNITSLTNIGDITLPNVVNASYMFSGCTNLKSVGNITMTSVTNCSYMFNNCSKLASTINLTSFPVVTDTSYMFNGCTSLPTVFGDIILPNVDNVTSMFGGIKFTEVGSVDLPTMILDLTNITKLGNVTLRKQTSARAMFFNNQKLLEIGDIYLPMATDVGGMFAGCINMSKCGKLTAPEATNGLYYASTSVNGIYSFGIFTLCSSLTEIRFPLLKGDNSPNDHGSTSDHSKDHSDGYFMFGKCSNLSSIIFDEDIIPLYSMRFMFQYCTSLTSMRIPNTPNVLRMTGIFYGCASLTSVIITSLDNVIDITNMFKDCTSLTTVNIPTECANIENASSVFYNCTSLEKIVLPKMESLIDGSSMFKECTKLKSVKTIESNNKIVSDINIPSLYTCVNVSNMFENCTSITSVYIGESSNLTTIQSMFAGCTSLTDIKHLDFPISITSTDNKVFNNVSIRNIDYYKAYNLFGLSLSNIQTVGTLSLAYPFGSSQGNLFQNNTNLISIDILELTNATHMYATFSGCANLEYVNKIIAPKLTSLGNGGGYGSIQTNTSYLSTGTFYNCTSLITTPDMSKCPNVKYANFTFYGCSSLNNINLKLPNLQYTTQMFQGCTSLNTIEYLETGVLYSSGSSEYYLGMYEGITNPIDINEIVVRNVNSIPPTTTTINKINMIGCFLLKQLTNLISVNEYKTDVTSLQNVFSGSTSITYVGKIIAPNATCAYTTSLTSNIQNSSIFYNCTNLQEQPIFECPNLTDLTYLFYGCEKLQNIDLSSFENVTSLWGTCINCIGLLSTPILPSDCSKITNISALFSGCTSLTEIDLSSYNFSSVKYARSLFYNCTNVSSLKLSSNMPIMEDINSMFYNCKKLTQIDLSNYDLSKVIDTRYMFYGCTNLQEILLPSFTDKLTNVSYMFSGCTSLRHIDNLVIPANINSNSSYKDIFTDCQSLSVDYIEVYDPTILSNISNIGYLKLISSNISYIYLSGVETIGTIEVPNVTSYIILSNNTITNIDKVIGPNLTTIRFNLSKLINVPDITECTSLTTLYSLFEGCSLLTDIDMSSYDLSNLNITDISYMFNGCTKLLNVKLPILNDSLITKVSHMFDNCSSLNNIDLSGHIFSNVTNVSFMFRGCTNLQEIKYLVIPSFDSLSSSNYQMMFYNCNSLTKLGHVELYTLSNTSISMNNITSIEYLKINASDTFLSLKNCTKLETIGTIELPNVTSVNSLFYGCSLLKTIENIIIPTQITDVNYMFYSCSSLTNIDLSSYDFSKVTLMEFMCSDCTSLTSIKLPDDLSSVTSLYSTFNRCASLISISLPDLPVIDKLYNIFNGCTNLQEIKRLSMPNYNPTNSSSYSNAFYNCTSLTKLGYIDIYNFKTCPIPLTNITDIEYLKINDNTSVSFSSASKLATVGTLEMPNTTTLAYLFKGCRSLISVDKIIAPNATTTYSTNATDSIFYNCISLIKIPDFTECASLTNLIAMFYGCTSLVEADLSGYDLSNITEMNAIFAECDSLVSLKLPNNLAKVSSIFGIVRNCTSLTEIQLPLQLPSVTNAKYAFKGCTSLVNIELPDLPKVTDVTEMFNGDTNLRRISKINMPAVTTSTDMFKDCTALEEISEYVLGDYSNTGLVNQNDIVKKWTLTNESITGFRNDTALTTISNVYLPNATSIAGLFSGCTNLVSVDGIDAPIATTQYDNTNLGMFNNCLALQSATNINIPKVTNGSHMFDGCTSLITTQLLSIIRMINVTSLFLNATSLENLTVEQLPLMDLTDWKLNSKVLTSESIDSIINALQDNSSNTEHTYVIQLSNEVVANVTMEQARLITDKNWKLINLDGTEWKDVYSTVSPTAVNPVSNLSVINASSTGESVKISWTDPDNIVDENGITIAKWAGTKIVRKVGSYPEYVTDGVLVCDSTVKNQYATVGYKDNGLTNGETYYYKAFPYTIAGVYNYNEANNISISTTPKYSEYGVRWDKSSNPTLTRLGDAVGLVANVGVDSTVVQNDFDNIYPWSERKQCNLSVDGEVLAYKGDPDFATDGTNGMVMVETPIFYQKYVETDDYIEYWISDGPGDGYRLNPRFIKKDGTILDKIYTGAYEAVEGDTPSKLASKSGFNPRRVNLTVNGRPYAKNIGTGWGLTDIAYRSDILFYLFTIEFATLNSQSIMMGPVSNSSILSTGLTDNIVASSGSVTSNTTGKNSFIYRGEENP